MEQDLRELFKADQKYNKPKLKSGHEKRFLKRLDNERFVRKKKSYTLLKIAATVLIIISVAVFSYKNNSTTEPLNTTVVSKVPKNNKAITLGDLSPDLKKVEDYYETTIHVALYNLEVSEENKSLVNSYLEQLTTLNSEYEKLNLELNESGPNDQTISALIRNLQLRLQLLQRLRKKINQFKTVKNDQTI